MIDDMKWIMHHFSAEFGSKPIGLASPSPKRHIANFEDDPGDLEVFEEH